MTRVSSLERESCLDVFSLPFRLLGTLSLEKVGEIRTLLKAAWQVLYFISLIPVQEEYCSPRRFWIRYWVSQKWFVLCSLPSHRDNRSNLSWAILNHSLLSETMLAHVDNQDFNRHSWVLGPFINSKNKKSWLKATHWIRGIDGSASWDLIILLNHVKLPLRWRTQSEAFYRTKLCSLLKSIFLMTVGLTVSLLVPIFHLVWTTVAYDSTGSPLDFIKPFLCDYRFKNVSWPIIAAEETYN